MAISAPTQQRLSIAMGDAAAAAALCDAVDANTARVSASVTAVTTSTTTTLKAATNNIISRMKTAGLMSS